MDTRIHVAVGVIFNAESDQVLITKRSKQQHLAGLWEFPGGKVEKGESVTSALCRELNEELGIAVKEIKQLTTVSHDYPDKNVLLDVWSVYTWSGEPISKEGQEITWAKINELNNYDFPKANKHIIQTLSLDPLYVISPASYKNETEFLSILDECFTSGLKLFQLRLDLRMEPEFNILINKVSQLAKKYSTKLILNGEPDDIKEYDIEGIHLKSKKLLNYKKRPISEEYILGASCHNESELLHAEKLNVNYAFISPVLKTGSHPEQKEIGWDNFHSLSKKVKFPIYALGGMNPKDLNLAKKYNAYGVAMISAIWNSNIPIRNIIHK